MFIRKFLIQENKIAYTFERTPKTLPMPKSFYDLDFWIEINEKRDEDLRSEYDKILGKISNIVIIYPAISVFLVAVWKDFFKTKISYAHFFNILKSITVKIDSIWKIRPLMQMVILIFIFGLLGMHCFHFSPL